MTGLEILGTGRSLPKRVVTNDELSKTVDTSDEWIVERTGIRQRYFCEAETNADLATAAARQAVERAGVAISEIGVCIVCTFTPDLASPGVSSFVHQSLGLPEDIPCFDLNGACSGFLYGLQVAKSLLADSSHPCALVVGSEMISRMMDFSIRSTCVLFGDGAGAVVLRLSERHRFESVLGSRGDTGLIVAKTPGTGENAGIHMDGQQVFRFAVDAIPKTLNALLEKSGLSLDEIDWVVCHQANARIIDHVAKKMKSPPEKFYKNIDRYGNTSAASIPIVLDELASEGKVKPGDKLLCVGFGAGLTWGGALLQW